MSFYINALLEADEFMGNTGFDDDAIVNSDDKYAIELKDISQAVDDINADYADQSSQEELDGQDINEDPVNEAMIAIYESECNWNVIMQAIGTREVLEAARGREMVMEAVDVKGYFQKVKEFFARMWKKITAIFKQFLDNAMTAFKTNKQFLAKYGNKLEEGKKAYEADTSKKKFKGYNFKNVSDVVTFVKAQEANNNEMESAARNLINSIEGGSKSYDVSGLERSADKFRGELCGGKESVSTSEFRKELKIAYFGSEEKVTLDEKTVSVANIKDILNRSQDDVKNIKKAYNTMRKGFEKVIKALKDLERVIGKSEKAPDLSEGRSEAMGNVTKYINAQKEMKNAGIMSSSMLMKAMKAEKAQARKIANAYMFALNKGKKKAAFDKADGKVSESGFLAGLDLI